MKVRIIFCLIFFMVAVTACKPAIESASPSVGNSTETPGLTQESADLPTATYTPTISPTRTVIPLGIEIEKLSGITLQFWHPWTGELATVVETLVEEFNTENPYDIVVQSHIHGDSLSRNVLEGIRTGIFPDIGIGKGFEIQSWDNHRNIVVDLNNYVYSPEWGLSPTETADFYSKVWKQDVFMGKRLGIPSHTSASILFYNQSWAWELGYTAPPETTGEFRDQVCGAAASSTNPVFSTNTPTDGIGGWIASIDPATIMSWVFAFGGNGIDINFNGYAFNSPETENAFGFIKGLFRSGCAWFPTDRSPVDEFAAGRGLIFSSDVSTIKSIEDAINNEDAISEWIVIPYPGDNELPVVNLYNVSYAILESTPERQLAAWLFIKWMTQPESQATFIEASGYLPPRVSTMDLLADYAGENPQWALAQDMVTYSMGEPIFGSWTVARWALSDAVTELLSPDFPGEGIPQLLTNLDKLLAEIHDQYR